MGDIFDTARSVPILEECRSRGIAVDRQNRFMCWMHNDGKNPSGKIFPQTNSFFCYQCSAGGDVIRFVELHDGITAIEAANQLTREIDAQPSPVEQKRRAILRADTEFVKGFVEDANATFSKLCDLCNVGRWVLDNCPPRLDADGQVTTKAIYIK